MKKKLPRREKFDSRNACRNGEAVATPAELNHYSLAAGGSQNAKDILREHHIKEGRKRQGAQETRGAQLLCKNFDAEQLRPLYCACYGLHVLATNVNISGLTLRVKC